MLIPLYHRLQNAQENFNEIVSNANFEHSRLSDIDRSVNTARALLEEARSSWKAAVSELPQTERSKIQDELAYISRKQERLNAFSQEVPKLRSEYRSSSSYERTNFWGNSPDEQLTKAMAKITSLKRCFIALLEEIDSKRAACTPN